MAYFNPSNEGFKKNRNFKNMYNPNSVSSLMERHRFDSYWKNTFSFASINTFITMNYAELKDDV